MHPCGAFLFYKRDTPSVSLRGCLFNWLREMDLFRFASLAADFCRRQTGAFQSPNPCTEPPFSVVQPQPNTRI